MNAIVHTGIAKAAWVVIIAIAIMIGGRYLANYHIAHSLHQQLERHKQVAADLQNLSVQILNYKKVHGFYPTTEQGLQSLVTERQALSTLPKDPWGNDYVYVCPGRIRSNGYDLYSAGPDRIANTADDDWGN